jgi:hypothetical protein
MSAGRVTISGSSPPPPGLCAFRDLWWLWAAMATLEGAAPAAPAGDEYSVEQAPRERHPPALPLPIDARRKSPLRLKGPLFPAARNSDWESPRSLMVDRQRLSEHALARIMGNIGEIARGRVLKMMRQALYVIVASLALVGVAVRARPCWDAKAPPAPQAPFATCDIAADCAPVAGVDCTSGICFCTLAPTRRSAPAPPPRRRRPRRSRRLA